MDLYRKGYCVYPTTHQKLKCVNEHGIDAMRKARKSARITQKKIREKVKLYKGIEDKSIKDVEKAKNKLKKIRKIK